MRPSRILGVGLAFFIVALCPGWLLQQDASARLVIARQLWQNQTVFIDKARPERYVHTPNGYTTYFGIGQSLLFIPFDRLGYSLGKHPSLSKWWNNHIQVVPLLLFYLPLIGLLWWKGLRFLLRCFGLTENAALTWGTLYFVFSAMIVYSAQTFQEESILGALSAYALGHCILWKQAGSRKSAILSGLFGATSLVFRLNAVFILLPIVFLFIQSRRWKDCRWFAAGVFFPALVFFLFSYWRFGSPFNTGYQLSYAQILETGRQVWRPPNLEIAWDLLFGPGKGFIITSPILLLALIGLVQAWKKDRILWTSVLLALVGSAIFHSCLRGFSCGGHSWGGRFQIHFLTLFGYPAYLGAQAISKTTTGKVILVSLFLTSLFIQILAISAPESLEYHQEIAVHGDYQERLITGVGDGQVAARLENVVRQIQKRPVFPAETPEERVPILENTRLGHMPNLWGFSYSVQKQGPPVNWRMLWAINLCFAVGCIVLGLIYLQNERPFRSIFEMSSRHLRRLSLDLVSRRLSS